MTAAPDGELERLEAASATARDAWSSKNDALSELQRELRELEEKVLPRKSTASIALVSLCKAWDWANWLEGKRQEFNRIWPRLLAGPLMRQQGGTAGVQMPFYVLD